ncbi:MAG TPA: hypothetical protein VER11_11050 [Polyangiaceae bacterium]|nr:hypothetical protein [Polyangiaceae bacterium]
MNQPPRNPRSRSSARAAGHGEMGTLEVSPVLPGSPVVRPFQSPMTIHEAMLSFGSALNF